MGEILVEAKGPPTFSRGTIKMTIIELFQRMKCFVYFVKYQRLTSTKAKKILHFSVKYPL
ncbi:hypothetical protein D8S85_11065 [Butyricimonas faecalis]|uniref:Uncharacterized protein n=1 Tax=Butyricimonas faecalis TaxID=2093856 RepID=A0A3Q9IR02_9BACT|nr:hypothetical protein D8S85_11065 [Butyricimonas faecalis]